MGIFSPPPPSKVIPGKTLLMCLLGSHTRAPVPKRGFPGSSEPTLVPSVEHASPVLQKASPIYFTALLKACQHLKTSDNQHTIVRLGDLVIKGE